MKNDMKKYWFTIETTVETNYSLMASGLEEAHQRVTALQHNGVVGDHGILWDNVPAKDQILPNADRIMDEWQLTDQGGQVTDEKVTDVSQHNH
jgi:hypothetical protein